MFQEDVFKVLIEYQRNIKDKLEDWSVVYR